MLPLLRERWRFPGEAVGACCGVIQWHVASDISASPSRSYLGDGFSDIGISDRCSGCAEF
ncbi:MAG: hypothetical protein V8T87_14705 [Victivallales bacterium]